jgi:hypothetical protein
MSSVPHVQADPRRKLTEFIKQMREAAPFGAIDWEAAMWDVTGRLTRAGKRLHIATRDSLWFTQLQLENGDPRTPFSDDFDDFAKAVICARHLRASQTAGAHRVALRALRYLDAQMRSEGLCEIMRLECRHFRDAEIATKSREMASSAYRVAQRLEEIATIIDQHNLTSIRIQYSSSIRKSSVAAIATKMPRTETLEVLGDVSGSKDLYDSRSDLILMRVVDLLAATGFRIGEVLSLPKDPIVASGEGIGLRYWPEKGGETRIKPIANVHRELVERAVADLMSACADARSVALWCERNPGRAPLPEGLPEFLPVSVVESLGLAANGISWLRQNRVSVLDTDGLMVQRCNLEKALADLRDDRTPLSTGEARTQPLSQFLIVLFRNELHADRSTNRFVPTWMRQGQIADFLGARDSTVSIFKRRNLRDKDGNFHKITTHQFRHWLHTIGKRGGLSEVELARWMGRKRIADNRAYDHRTQEERVEEARSLIRSGRAGGAVADTYRSLPPADAEAFLNAQVGSALTTPYGMCLHDYGQGPCERHFSCAGCGELLRRKGDPDERAALSSMLERTRRSLDEASTEGESGAIGASNWVAHNERLVIDLVTILAVDDNPEIADGTLVPVWPGNSQKKDCTDVA